jgi:hypothetical protein
LQQLFLKALQELKKNLNEAAEYYCKGGVIDDTQEDARVLGIALPEQKPEKDFEVWEENWPSVELFLRVQTQWNTSVGGITGLNYAGVLAIMELYKYDDSIAVFEGLQIMEIKAMSLLNKEGK